MPDSPATLLVFGASGAVGRHLLQQAGAAYRLIAVSRAPPADASGATWLRADLTDARFAWPAVDGALSLGPLDAFVGWLARYPHTRLRRIVALSSMSAESKRASPDPAERALAARLVAAEDALHELAAARAIACTVFRPTLIYGAGNDRSLAPIVRFLRRWRVLPLPLGACGLRQPVHAADLAAACLAVLERPLTHGKTYPLGGGERLRFDALLLRLRAAVPGFVLPVPLPIPLLRLAARCWRGAPAGAAFARLREPLIADNDAAARDFGYAPRPFRAAEVLPPDAAAGIARSI
jgi:nucleoside-diphosphate-sugar epimerase